MKDQALYSLKDKSEKKTCRLLLICLAPATSPLYSHALEEALVKIRHSIVSTNRFIAFTTTLVITCIFCEI